MDARFLFESKDKSSSLKEAAEILGIEEMDMDEDHGIIVIDFFKKIHSVKVFSSAVKKIIPGGPHNINGPIYTKSKVDNTENSPMRNCWDPRVWNKK